MKPVGFMHPTLRNLRPAADPAAQVEACTALREEMLFEGAARVTTMLPKRGGAAVMIGWDNSHRGKGDPICGPYLVTEAGEVTIAG